MSNEKTYKMTISHDFFANHTEYDLTNGQHQYPNLTLRKHSNMPSHYVIANYVTRKVHLTFSDLGTAADYCNTHFDTNLSYSL